MTAVSPGGPPELDGSMLESYPVVTAMWHVERGKGFRVADGLPGLIGALVQRLHGEGVARLGAAAVLNQ